MKQSILMTALVLGTILPADSAEGEWTWKTDMPTARFGLSMAEVDGKLFAIGGSQSNSRLATVEEYDPATDEWSPKANMPTARKNTAAAVVNGIIYETSANLQDWSEVTTGLVAANGDADTYQFELVDPMADVLFIRVRRE